MGYPALPGDPPERLPLGQIDPTVATQCHPFLRAEDVAVRALRACYASGAAGGPEYIKEHWLQIEAGIALRDPDRVLAARQGLQEVVDRNHTEWTGRAALAQCYISSFAWRAAGMPLTPEIARETQASVARLLGKGLLRRGDRGEAIILEAAAYMAKDDPSYFLSPSSPREGMSGSKPHNPDAYTPDGLPVQIKLASSSGSYDSQILPISVWKLMVRAEILEISDRRDPLVETETAIRGLAIILRANARKDAVLPMLADFAAALRSAMDDHRSNHRIPPILTPLVARSTVKRRPNLHGQRF